MSETIAAISTALGEGTIEIVRLSGSQTFSIADKIIKLPKNKKNSKYRKSYYKLWICN